MSEEEYISSTFSVSIPEFAEKYIDSKTVTFYIVDVKDNVSKQSWKLDKRYSDFENLHKNIIKLFPNVPAIPGKSLFKITAFEALTKRRIELELFLKDCARRKDIVAHESFKIFLEVEKHAPEIKYNTPSIIFSFEQIPLGIRDFYQFSKENILFIVCCDMNITSRVDAYLINVNLPWEKKTGAHIPVGAFFAFKIHTNKPNGYGIEKLWAKSFPEQTGVVNFDEEALIVQVGLDTGSIVIYQTTVESNYVQYDEKHQFKPHTNRVMGVAYDGSKDLVYSCASDKKFLATTLSTGESKEIAESTSGYTALVFDKTNSRIFLTNEAGVVSVFLTNENPALLVKVIQTHTENVIRGVFIDYRKNLFFTATNKGDISILDLGPPGKEKLIDEMSYFGGNVEIRVMQYNSENNELFTGDQDGKITVWNLKLGESISIL